MGRLNFEIKCIEDCIRIRQSLGKDVTFEKDLVKEYRKYLPGGKKITFGINS